MASEEVERIGELLIEEGVVTQDELARAITDAGLKGSALAAALESCKHPKRQDLAVFLANDFRVPKLADLRNVDFQAEAVRAVPEELARKHELVPVVKVGGILCVAKPNYYNRAAVQDLRRQTGLKIKVLQADEGQVKAAIDRVYGGKAEIPAPKGEKKETVRRVRPAPSVEEAMPLISQPSGEEPRGQESAADVLAAVRVSAAEYQAEERSAYARLFRDWDDLFVTGRPSTPIKVG